MNRKTEENLPKVSVIVRTCNRAVLLEETLKSIADQIWKNIQVVLVNDGTHSVHQIVEKFNSTLYINYFEHDSPKGRSAAANTGLKNASGDYICFLDDDDLFMPDHIKSLVDVLQNEDSFDVAYTGVQCIDGAGKPIKNSFNDPFDRVRLKAGNYIPFNAIMFRSFLLEKVAVDESIDLYEDWDFLLQLIEYSDFKHLKGKSALYRIVQGSGFGVVADKNQVEKAAKVILDKWCSRWPAADLREQVKDYNAREHSYQKQLKDYNTREHSYQKQLKDYHTREQSYQKQLKDYHTREQSYQKQLEDYTEKQAVYLKKQKEMQAKLEYRQNLINEKEFFINQLISSYSWRITAPLRAGKLAFKNMVVKPARKVVNLVKNRKNTVGISAREQAKKKLFFYESIVKPVPKLKSDPVENPLVRMIALYLPQFHSIPENDKWWGKGFTEWTNVRPAVPQFEGHYQPHVPGALGYYDLKDKTVLKDQVEMARLYGIHGFCFYFYWFAGKRLLEKPLLQFLEDGKLDMPFCLAWANENWTRRWDGLDNEILIGQDYSPEDDINFIKYLSKYLKDKRYIKIDGKPLVIVYRPNLLPSAARTSERWRKWCLENGIGEIYLAYTQSFEKKDPAKYGFDAAIEFPPNESAPPDITNQMINKRQGFKGTVFDWRELVQRSFDYTNPGYTLFRSVNPSWDNTARKKQNGIIFANSSPFGFLHWLYNALSETVKRVNNQDERVVFINAWNEWAEGAHLEPDEKHGYAYLEAARMALQRFDLVNSADLSQSSCKKTDTEKTAFVIHAYYIDVFQELIEAIKKIDMEYKVFVTTVKEHEQQIDDILSELGKPYRVVVVDNHGRDVLPFFKIIEFVLKEDFTCFLKIHTKKSSHRKDGDIWRNDLYNKLLNKENLKSFINACQADKTIGLIGPGNHIVHMSTYLGSNEKKVKWYSERMGLTFKEVIEIPFAAGTMFFARMESIKPLLSLAIDEDDFEFEDGQVDGTLAHAIERLFSISTVAAGLKIVDTDYIGKQTGSIHVNNDYKFVG